MDERKAATRIVTNGKRIEILKTLYANALLPYRSLKLYAGEISLTQAKAIQMVNEGEILRIGKGRDSVLVLNDGWKEGTIHWQDVEDDFIKRREELSEELGRCLRDGGETRLARLGKRSELNLMMHMAGIHSYPDEKEKMFSNSFKDVEPIYYNADEVKDATCYVDEVKEEDGIKQVTNTRIAGLMIAPSGIYATYSLGNKLIEWSKYGEIRMKGIIHRTIGEKNHELIKDGIDCIVFADNYKLFERVVMNDLNDNPAYSSRILLNIDLAYDHMYALPTDKNGIAILEEMKNKNWILKMKELLLGDYEEPSAGEIVTCDAIQDDKYILLFTTCDISRLKSFINRARMMNNRDKFVIYCFSFQTQLIKRLAGDYVTIMEVELSDYKEEAKRREN